MQTNQKDYDHIPALDGLRCISILIVLFGHYIENTGYVLPIIYRPSFDGALGVNMFFAISGFLITRIVLASEKSESGFSFRDFYVKRIAKLVPVLWLYIALISVAAWHFNGVLHVFDSLRAAAFLTMHSKLMEPSVLNHTWSLSVEEFFYLSWVPLLYFRQRLNPHTVKMLIGAALLSAPLARIFNVARASENWVKYLDWYPLPVIPIIGSLDFLVAGACVFLFKKEISVFLRPLYRKSSLTLAISAVILTAVPSIATVLFGIVSLINAFIGGTLQAIGICLIIHLLANERQTDPLRLLESKPMVTIGLSSYSIYVVQQVCFYSIPGSTLNRDFLVYGSLPCALIGGITIFYFVERPINRYLRSKWLRKTLEPQRN